MNDRDVSPGGFVNRGYKYRLYPTKEQEQYLKVIFGHARFVWNRVLETVIHEYDCWKQNPALKKPDVSKIGITYYVYPLKQSNPWLYDVPAVALEQKVRDLSSSFSSFFGRKRRKGKVGYPKFKSKDHAQSFRLKDNAFRIREGKFFIPHCKEPIDVLWSRNLPSDPSSCTISKNPCGEYFVSFVCKAPPKVTNGSGRVGIDLGLTHFATESNGKKILNQRFFIEAQGKLRREQRNLSRKQKGSIRYEKQRIKVAKCNRQIANKRHDFLHQYTRDLINNNQVIGIENLSVSDMVHFGHLAKHISDASWGIFRKYLEYKTEESNHVQLVIMDSFFPSSHICSVCRTRLDRRLKLKERSWVCPSCNTTHDRDLNAAKNICKVAEETAATFKLLVGETIFADYEHYAQ